MRLEVIRRGTGEVAAERVDVPATPAAVAAQREQDPRRSCATTSEPAAGRPGRVRPAGAAVRRSAAQLVRPRDRCSTGDGKALARRRLAAVLPPGPRRRRSRRSRRSRIERRASSCSSTASRGCRGASPTATTRSTPARPTPAPASTATCATSPAGRCTTGTAARLRPAATTTSTASATSPARSPTPSRARQGAGGRQPATASTAFAVPVPVFSLDELAAKAGGKDKLDAYLAWSRRRRRWWCRAPGIEEAFGLFHGADAGAARRGWRRSSSTCGSSTRQAGDGRPRRLLEPPRVREGAVLRHLRPGDGAALSRPTCTPTCGRSSRARTRSIWLRPQMYESVPYERWRFHTYVELMRGCRGWQIAHGPGDASLFRGLHGEMELLEADRRLARAGPQVTIEPGSSTGRARTTARRYVIAATTHGIPLGHWRVATTRRSAAGRSRVTDGRARELATRATPTASASPPRRGRAPTASSTCPTPAPGRRAASWCSG